MVCEWSAEGFAPLKLNFLKVQRTINIAGAVQQLIHQARCTSMQGGGDRAIWTFAHAQDKIAAIITVLLQPLKPQERLRRCIRSAPMHCRDAAT